MSTPTAHMGKRYQFQFMFSGWLCSKHLQNESSTTASTPSLRTSASKHRPPVSHDVHGIKDALKQNTWAKLH